MPLLNDAELTSAADGLLNWTIAADRTALTKQFRFDGFAGAMAWMVRVGFEAERANHHPEWSNVYNRVSVTLTTHDAGGLTEKDVALARKMEDFS